MRDTALAVLPADAPTPDALREMQAQASPAVRGARLRAAARKGSAFRDAHWAFAYHGTPASYEGLGEKQGPSRQVTHTGSQGGHKPTGRPGLPSADLPPDLIGAVYPEPRQPYKRGPHRNGLGNLGRKHG